MTDNAFVTGNLIPVYSDATGIVAEVLYEETEDVKKGDLLIRLDAQRARAALGEAEGELGRAVRAVGALFATRQQICQKIVSRTALFNKVRHDIVRYREALPSGSVSKQVLQNAEDQKASLEADLKEARAEFQSIEARVGGTSRINHPDIEVAKNKFIDAYIEFARQQIRAPVSGYIAKRRGASRRPRPARRPGDDDRSLGPSMGRGELVGEQAALGAAGPAGAGHRRSLRTELHISWNRGGAGARHRQRVRFVTPGGATGNFIHIVERVPVRIALQKDEILSHPIRPGLSAVISIDIRKSGRRQTPR